MWTKASINRDKFMMGPSFVSSAQASRMEWWGQGREPPALCLSLRILRHHPLAFFIKEADRLEPKTGSPSPHERVDRCCFRQEKLRKSPLLEKV